jgi:hypothetical protein
MRHVLDLRGVVLIGANVELVRRHESDPRFRVEGESQTSHHLQIELIVLVKSCQVLLLD